MGANRSATRKKSKQGHINAVLDPSRPLHHLPLHRLPLRRAPLLRSAKWAFLIGAVGGALVGTYQTFLFGGGLWWSLLGAVGGILLGLVVGCDLLLPGPMVENVESPAHGRVGPFRLGILLLLLMAQGLFVSAYLWGDITLACQQQRSGEIDCSRTSYGWFNSRQTGELRYMNVIGVALDVHDELLLQHGPYQQSQSVPGFGAVARDRIALYLAAPTAPLIRGADRWTVRLAVPICLLLALLSGLWAYFSLRQGLTTLRAQFVLQEIYWGWRSG